MQLSKYSETNETNETKQSYHEVVLEPLNFYHLAELCFLWEWVGQPIKHKKKMLLYKHY